MLSPAEPVPGLYVHPDQLGVAEQEKQPNGIADHVLYDLRPGSSFPVIRPGFTYGFQFSYLIPPEDAAHPELTTARPMVRFTDDVGLAWEIDRDLRLTRRAEPRDRWIDLLTPPGRG